MVAVKRWLSRFAVAAMLGFGALSLMGVAAHAEPGVFDDRIVFGQSAAFDGPAGALGLAMREGILASFNEANATGGVNGHRLELVSYDVSRRPHNTTSAAPFADIPAELGVLQLPYRRHL